MGRLANEAIEKCKRKENFIMADFSRLLNKKTQENDK